MSFLIQNVTIISADSRQSGVDVLVADGLIQAIAPQIETGSHTCIDGTDKYLTAGWIDMQCNGGFGLDITNNPETLWDVAAQLPQYGITSFLPTVITSAYETIEHVQQVLATRPEGYLGAEPLGLHVEGPFLNPKKKGAHPVHHLREPDVEYTKNWSPETGVRLVTLAPELPNGAEAIAQLAEQGVIVSMGHSMATYEEATTSIDNGVSYATHLFNAMTPLHHRTPGMLGRLLEDDRVVLGIIPDGEHVHPSLISSVWELAKGRVNVVTDCMSAMGVPPGVYPLGDKDVTVDATTAKLPDGTLAGSIVTLDLALRNLLKWTSATEEEAVATVTTIPAKLLGQEELGRVATNEPANFVLLTSQFTVEMSVVNGQVAYDAQQRSINE